MRTRSRGYRKVTNGVILVISIMASLMGLLALVWILYNVILFGAGALDLQIFTHLPRPPGMEGGGLANAIVGTFLISLLATALGVPLGLMAGVYLSEYGRGTHLGAFVHFSTNVMMGIPSIIVGLFAYTLLVAPWGHFSGYSGAVALAIIMLPVVGRTSEDMLTLVPNALREASLALGASRWRTTLSVVFRSARAGLVTGALLAIARVSGETAPLLFTALNNPYWPDDLTEPTANLTVTIFAYALSPYEDWQRLAWGASLIIVASVLGLIVLARVLSEVRR